MNESLVEVPFGKHTPDAALAEAQILRWPGIGEVLADTVATPDDSLNRFTVTGTLDGKHEVYWTDGPTGECMRRPIDGLRLLMPEATARKLKLL